MRSGALLLACLFTWSASGAGDPFEDLGADGTIVSSRSIEAVVVMVHTRGVPLLRNGNERLCRGRFGRHHGSETARSPLHPAEEVLADVGIGDRIVRKADGGRRPKTIWEIPVKRSR